MGQTHLLVTLENMYAVTREYSKESIYATLERDSLFIIHNIYALKSAGS